MRNAIRSLAVLAGLFSLFVFCSLSEAAWFSASQGKWFGAGTANGVKINGGGSSYGSSRTPVGSIARSASEQPKPANKYPADDLSKIFGSAMPNLDSRQVSDIRTAVDSWGGAEDAGNNFNALTTIVKPESINTMMSTNTQDFINVMNDIDAIGSEKFISISPKLIEASGAGLSIWAESAPVQYVGGVRSLIESDKVDSFISGAGKLNSILGEYAGATIASNAGFGNYVVLVTGEGIGSICDYGSVLKDSGVSMDSYTIGLINDLMEGNGGIAKLTQVGKDGRMDELAADSKTAADFFGPDRVDRMVDYSLNSYLEFMNPTLGSGASEDNWNKVDGQGDLVSSRSSARPIDKLIDYIGVMEKLGVSSENFRAGLETSIASDEGKAASLLRDAVDIGAFGDMTGVSAEFIEFFGAEAFSDVAKNSLALLPLAVDFASDRGNDINKIADSLSGKYSRADVINVMKDLGIETIASMNTATGVPEGQYIDLIENRMNSDDRPVAVIIQMTDDYNGATLNPANANSQKYEDQGYRVAYYKVSNETEFKNAMLDATEKGAKPADIVEITGHGNPGSLSFSDGGNDLSELDVSDAGWLKDLNSTVSPGGDIILSSCSVGSGMGDQLNLANAFAIIFPQAQIYSPNAPTIGYNPDFNDDGSLKSVVFTDQSGTDITYDTSYDLVSSLFAWNENYLTWRGVVYDWDETQALCGGIVPIL